MLEEFGEIGVRLQANRHVLAGFVRGKLMCASACRSVIGPVKAGNGSDFWVFACSYDSGLCVKPM